MKYVPICSLDYYRYLCSSARHYKSTTTILKTQTPNKMGSKIILIVDDDKEDRELLEEVISSEEPQTRVHSLANGYQLLDYLEKCSETNLPHIVILDYNMPLLNGAELLAIICKDIRYQDIPIVILSTSNAPKHVEECMNRGAKEYFVKPTDIRELTTLTHRILSLSN